MVGIAIIALGFWIVDTVKMANRIGMYRRMAEAYERMARECRRIDGLDEATRVREADEALDDPFLDNPEWTHRMIPWAEGLKLKYRDAASHPRLPVPPDPPQP